MSGDKNTTSHFIEKILFRLEIYHAFPMDLKAHSIDELHGGMLTGFSRLPAAGRGWGEGNHNV
jgi:hypothetical protein